MHSQSGHSPKIHKNTPCTLPARRWQQDVNISKLKKKKKLSTLSLECMCSLVIPQPKCCGMSSLLGALKIIKTTSLTGMSKCGCCTMEVGAKLKTKCIKSYCALFRLSNIFLFVHYKVVPLFGSITLVYQFFMVVVMLK